VHPSSEIREFAHSEDKTMTTEDIIARLSDLPYPELDKIAAAAQALIDEEKARVLAQAQQMGLVKPRKPRGNSKHATE
jgi:hypothetical protein